MYLDKVCIIAKRKVYALLRNKQKYKYTNFVKVMLMRLMSKGEYVIVPKGTKFTRAGKLGLKDGDGQYLSGLRRFETMFQENRN